MNQITDNVSLESTDNNTEEKVATKKTAKKKAAAKKAVSPEVKANSTKVTTKSTTKATTKAITKTGTKKAVTKVAASKKATTKKAVIKKSVAKATTTNNATTNDAATNDVSSGKADVVNPWLNNDWLNNASAFNFSSSAAVKKNAVHVNVKGISNIQEPKMPNENLTTKALKQPVCLKKTENSGIVDIFAQLRKTNNNSAEITPITSSSRSTASVEKKPLISSNIPPVKPNKDTQSVVDKKNEKNIQPADPQLKKIDKKSFQERKIKTSYTEGSVLVAFLNKSPQSLPCYEKAQVNNEKKEKIKTEQIDSTLNVEPQKRTDANEYIVAEELQQEIAQEKQVINEPQTKEPVDAVKIEDKTANTTNRVKPVEIKNQPLIESAITHIVLSSTTGNAKVKPEEEKVNIPHADKQQEPSAFQVAVEEINQNKVTTNNKPKIDLNAIRSELDNLALNHQYEVNTEYKGNKNISSTTQKTETKLASNADSKQKKENIGKQNNDVEEEGLIEGVSIAVFNGVKHIFSIGKYASIGLSESVKDSKKIASLALEKVRKK